MVGSEPGTSAKSSNAGKIVNNVRRSGDDVGFGGRRQDFSQASMDQNEKAISKLLMASLGLHWKLCPSIGNELTLHESAG